MPADRKLRLRHLFFDIGAEVREAWQQPLAETGYAAEGAFPLVSLLAPKVRAQIVLTGDPDDLDIFSSQMQAEPHVRNTLAQTSASWLSGGPFSARSCSRLPQAAASLGQSAGRAAWAAWAGHVGLESHIGGGGLPPRL